LTTDETITAFNQAFGRHDVDAVMALMTDDCIFENTLPPPDGERHAGRRDVRRFWETFFSESPNATFETEEMVVAGDRAVVRWRFNWGDGARPRHRPLQGARRKGRGKAQLRKGLTPPVNAARTSAS
jgi:ketosteroid isomerase-like protein